MSNNLPAAACHRAHSRDPLPAATRKHTFSFSRRIAPEVYVSFAPFENRGRRESRVHAAPAVSCAMCTGSAHTSIQVQRRHPGLPCAVVYDLLRALLGDRAFLPPSPRGPRPTRLDASVGASGPHDFAVRLTCRSSSAHPRPPHPTARFVTIASRPSHRVRWGKLISLICPTP